ncbi:MaoC family dehydratase N-terminal domain-containing protein [Effusibacillus dendaii]|uniref:Dehydratase n=1 Tax=Effusibacillus dendaii TaxID=2743772 RepID=A0A7I8D9U5_9BACL|nr:MaoC family dehydratase N-terminal domain-containing protein [Effusibacillus dendaii]BCJ86132.1 dehydratase [Effusibacillus dendaii]
MSRDFSGIIGKQFEPFTFAIERGKIREFAMAIGDGNPIYYDRLRAEQEGFADSPIPPTYATVIEMWGGTDFFEMTKALDINPLKVLHGEQEYEYLGDIYPGDQITGRTTVKNAVSKASGSGGMNLFTLETEYTNQAGEKVLVARSVIIERH